MVQVEPVKSEHALRQAWSQSPGTLWRCDRRGGRDVGHGVARRISIKVMGQTSVRSARQVADDPPFGTTETVIAASYVASKVSLESVVVPSQLGSK